MPGAPVPFPYRPRECRFFARALAMRHASIDRPSYFVIGDGNPIQSLAAVPFSDASSAQIGGPDSIGVALQIRANAGQPFVASLSRNLLSKNDCRSALGDKASKDWPQMPLVCEPDLLPGRGKRLAGAGTSPNRSAVSPSGKSERMRPSTDAGEEMALDIPSDVVGPHIGDRSLVNVASWDVSGGDKIAKPLRGIGVNLIVIGGHEACLVSTIISESNSTRIRGGKHYASTLIAE